MDTNFEKLLSIKEVADIMGVGRDTVVRLIKAGYLKAVVFPRLGGRGKNVKRQVSLGEVRRFLARYEKAA